MIGFNSKTYSGLVHTWRDSASPLNPTLMRSLCGKAYALKENIEPSDGRNRCSRCEQKQSPVPTPAEPR
jgi:hypothetical protein